MYNKRWAKVGKHRLALALALARRQAKGKSKRENRYVIKVMKLNKEGGQVLQSARTKS
jgi:hypothetical protein